MSPVTVKCMLLGDGCVGKTTFYITYTRKEFPTTYIPIIDGQEVQMGLWETTHGEDAAGLRPLTYPQTDVFILAFAVNSEHSFDNIRSLWLPEVRNYEPNVPIMLLGTKIDLRTSEENQDGWISTKMGKKTAKKLKLHKYIECSSLTLTNLDEVIDEAARIGLIHLQKREEKTKKKNTKCSIV